VVFQGTGLELPLSLQLVEYQFSVYPDIMDNHGLAIFVRLTESQFSGYLDTLDNH
jgi:hypothetical protein